MTRNFDWRGLSPSVPKDAGAARSIENRIVAMRQKYAAPDGMAVLAAQLEKHVKALEAAFATSGTVMRPGENTDLLRWKQLIFNIRKGGKS